jgi:hypothetical protein
VTDQRHCATATVKQSANAVRVSGYAVYDDATNNLNIRNLSVIFGGQRQAAKSNGFFSAATPVPTENKAGTFSVQTV